MIKKYIGRNVKLVRTSLNYSLLGTSSAAIFLLNDHSLHAYITSDEYHVFNSFLKQDHVESDKIQNEKVFTTLGLEPTTLRFLV